MERYSKLWRAFFALSLMAIAVQQLVDGGFKPVILPPSPVLFTGYTACLWLVSIVLILASAAIIFNFEAHLVSVYLGALLLLLLIIFQLPYVLLPHVRFFGSWGNAFKIMAYAGGAFVVAKSFAQTPGHVNTANTWLEKLVPAGRCLFAVTMVAFGVMHFIYSGFVAMLVPAWVPGHLFWTYFAGAALIAAGLAIILNIQLRLAANLLGAMIFIWLILLHIPRAIAYPHMDNGNEITSVFEALGFSGIAFLIAANGKGNQNNQQSA